MNNTTIIRAVFFLVTVLLLPGLAPCVAVASETAVNSKEILRMGIFPRRDARSTITLFSPMAQYLSEKLGRQVKLEVAKDLHAFWENVENKQYDLVHYNPYQYVRSHKQQGYQVILKNEEIGKDTVAGAIVVRKDSGIKTVKDLRDKNIVFFGGPKAMLSYMVNTSTLRKAGLHKDDYSQDFTNSPNNAVFAVYFGQADAAGIGNRGLKFPSINKKIDTSKLHYLVQSEQITHFPWAVKGEMPADLRSKLQKILSGMKESPEGRKILGKARLTGLNITSDEEYDIHRHIIWKAVQEDFCVRDCDYTKTQPVIVSGQRPLVLGIFPRRSKKWTIKMFTPLAQHLSRKLGRDVRLEVEKNFDDFWKKVALQRYDIVHYNQLQYVKSHKLHNYKIVAKIEERGSNTITPALLVRNNSEIKNTQDLRGKKILFSGNQTSMISYVANTQLLRKAGLNPGDYQESFTLSPWDACEATAKGQADSCAVSTSCLLLDRLRDEKGFRQLKILTQGNPMPHLVWSVGKNINDTLRKKIQSILVRLQDSTEGTAALESAWLSGIHSASNEEYDIHREVIFDILGERY